MTIGGALNDGPSAAHSASMSGNPLARSLLGVRIGVASPHVNIVLLDFNPVAVFAGVKTALETGSLIGTQTGMPVRLVLLRGSGVLGTDRDEFIRVRLSALNETFGSVTWSVVCDHDLATESFGAADLWVATHWMTAHALDLAARADVVETRRVIYLVQDYEPEYFAGPEDRPAAESTFRAGFSLLVNSRQVEGFLRERGNEVDPAQVFAPQFDTRPLQHAARHRARAAVPRVFFYGRRSTPRNLFSVGVDALRIAAGVLAHDDIQTEFVMAGEQGDDVDLGSGFVMRNLGVLDRASYFEMIARVDVGLTLQATPHPSHMPFDLAMSGAIAVTNEVDGSRYAMHPRIMAAAGTPEALASMVVHAITAARRAGRVHLGYLPVRDGHLGGSLRSAVQATLAHLVPAP